MLVQPVNVAVPEIDRIFADGRLRGGDGLDSVGSGADAGEVGGGVPGDGLEREKAGAAGEVEGFGGEGFVMPFLVGFEGGGGGGGDGGGH